ncbi:MAG: hypothetical protein KBA51_01165 [Kiritimatiellae bacterium]|nr:hypothetical protein [Kiritimatiellia bacterium]
MNNHRVFNIVFGAACAGLMVSAAVSFAQTRVASKNVVGYVSLTVDRGTMVMLRNDFLRKDGEASTPQSLFGANLPVGTEVLVWDSTLSGYSRSVYSISYGPPPAFAPITNWSHVLQLNRGTGFWLVIPKDAEHETYSVVLAGSVPDEEDHTTPIAENLNMAAYAFPVEVLWTNTTLAKSASIGDKAYLWTKSQAGTWGYQINTYETTYGPPPTFTPTTGWNNKSMLIPVGRAVWYQSATAKTWTEERPYPEF